MGESELLFVCLFVCLIFTGSMSWMAPEVLELTPQYPSPTIHVELNRLLLGVERWSDFALHMVLMHYQKLIVKFCGFVCSATVMCG